MFSRVAVALAGAAVMLAALGVETAAVRALAPAALELASPAGRVALARAGGVALHAVAGEIAGRIERAATPAVSGVLRHATRAAALAERLLGAPGACATSPGRITIECRTAALVAPLRDADGARAIELRTLAAERAVEIQRLAVERAAERSRLSADRAQELSRLASERAVELRRMAAAQRTLQQTLRAPRLGVLEACEDAPAIVVARPAALVGVAN